MVSKIKFKKKFIVYVLVIEIIGVYLILWIKTHIFL